ncbi:MAG: Wzy polymerase domain-containing protein [Burkholderiaceae bacterium]|nr:Wzy polymerase domain-containing protein [Burkholderiaceae bacterium]
MVTVAQVVCFSLAGVFTLFAWLSPNHYLPWTAFHNDLAMSVALLMLAAPLIWRSRRLRWALPPLAVLAAATTAVPLVQSAAGLILLPGDAWIASLYLAGFAFAIVLGHRIAADAGPDVPLRAFSWIAIAGGALSVSAALYQWQAYTFLDPFVLNMPVGGRPYGNLAQPNNFATLLLWGLVATAYLHSAARMGSVCATVVFAYLCLGVAMSESRGAQLGAGAVLVWLVVARIRDRSIVSTRALATGLLLLGVVFLAWSTMIDWSPVPTGRSADEAAVSMGRRLLHWTTMLDAIARHPLRGYGWNQVSTAQFLVAIDHPSSFERIEHSHSFILDLLVWNGIPLGLALVGCLTAWLFTALKRARTQPAVFSIAMILAVVSATMVEFQIEYAYFLLPLGLLTGGVSFATMKPLRQSANSVVVASIAILLATVTMMVAAEYLRLEEDGRVLRAMAANIKVDDRLRTPSNPMILSNIGEQIKFGRTPERDGMTEQELEAMRKVAMRYPVNSFLLRYAAALARNDHADAARDVLARICVTYPANACDAAHSQWQRLAASHPRIAAVNWVRQ